MNYQQAKKLINAMNEIETWANQYQREILKDDPDWSRIDQGQKWIDEAKQEIFDLFKEVTAGA